MIARNPKIQKFISALMIIAILVPSVLFSRPKKVEAIPTVDANVGFWTSLTSVFTGTSSVATVTSTGLSIKEWAGKILGEILKNLAKRLLKEMTTSTINWINTGFYGAPLFLENPQTFFKDIGKYEIKTFIDQIGYDNVRFPFGKSFALNVIDSYNRQLQENAQYSLSKVTNDPILLESYRTDFNVGGWNGFLMNTQYPQNNYLGSQMMFTDELARRLAGTSANNAQKIQTTLQQGMGFLSPQTCPSNPLYNTLTNQFQRPSFKPKPFDPPPYNDSVDSLGNPIIQDPALKAEYDLYVSNWEQTDKIDRENWDKTNTCPDGLVNTTPGSVVGNSIMTAMDSNYKQKELAAAMGNSISAILDTLLTKFLGSGLNALATKANTPPPADNWDYFGNTLGTVTPYGSTPWNISPDEIIVLSEFKTDLQSDIDNTALDISFLNKIAKTLDDTWRAVRILDMCLPGPDRNWEERLRDEKERNGAKLLEKSNDDDLAEAARAREASKELDYAVTFFADWIKNKMLLALPNSVNYIDAVEGLEAVYQESDELVDTRRRKTSTLARLNSIQARLNLITVEPAPGTQGEKTLIDLKRDFNATKINSSNKIGIEDTRNQLNTDRDRLNDIGTMTTDCVTERAKNKWAPYDPEGKGNSPGVDDKGRPGTEQLLFCGFPIRGGFSHGEISQSLWLRNALTVTRTMFINPVNPPQYDGEDLPMVNARNVFKYDKAFGSGNVDINIRCATVYKANGLDYKGSIPGVTGIPEKPPTDLPGGSDTQNPSGPLGSCGTMEPNSAIRGCSNYVEQTAVGQPTAAACSAYCAQKGADACEWNSNGNCYVEFGNGCSVQTDSKTCAYTSPACSFTGWSATTCSGGGGGDGADGGGGDGGGGGTTPPPVIPPGSQPASLRAQVQAERNKSIYPSSFASLCPNPRTLQPASCPLGALLNAVAWDNRDQGWGLLRKTSGHRCPSPAGLIACDVLFHKPSGIHYDVLKDAEDKATSVWISHTSQPVSKWVAPVQP